MYEVRGPGFTITSHTNSSIAKKRVLKQLTQSHYAPILISEWANFKARVNRSRKKKNKSKGYCRVL